MSKTKLNFPKGFWWGSATSGPQTEGNYNKLDGDKSESIWEKWYSKEKYRFFNMQPCRNELIKNYKGDVKIAKDLNFNSLRTSIQWSRLIPDGKNVNPKAIKFYNDYFDEMIKQGIEPLINLYHFDMPMWAQKKGGWTSREVAESFAFYAKTAVELFGKKVKTWFTMNEPIVPIEAQYLYDFHYPNIVSPTKAIQALWFTLLAHHKAIAAMRKVMPEGKYGCIVNITPAIPRDKTNLADLKASYHAELWQWKCFVDPMVKGVFSKDFENLLKQHKLWPKDMEQKGDRNIIKDNLIDILGINFYSPLRVKALDYVPNFDSNIITPNTHFFSTYAMPGRRMNIYRGWEIHPKSIYLMLKTLQEEYNNIECYIAENGMGVEGEEKFKKNGTIQDTYRIEFLNEHLYWVYTAIKEGSNCKGYHMWTYIDNWSWMNAYKNRYGFVSLDIETGKRTPKLSASWIKKVIKDNAILIEIEALPES